MWMLLTIGLAQAAEPPQPWMPHHVADVAFCPGGERFVVAGGDRLVAWESGGMSVVGEVAVGGGPAFLGRTDDRAWWRLGQERVGLDGDCAVVERRALDDVVAVAREGGTVHERWSSGEPRWQVSGWDAPIPDDARDVQLSPHGHVLLVLAEDRLELHGRGEDDAIEVAWTLPLTSFPGGAVADAAMLRIAVEQRGGVQLVDTDGEVVRFVPETGEPLALDRDWLIARRGQVDLHTAQLTPLEGDVAAADLLGDQAVMVVRSSLDGAQQVQRWERGGEQAAGVLRSPPRVHHLVLADGAVFSSHGDGHLRRWSLDTGRLEGSWDLGLRHHRPLVAEDGTRTWVHDGGVLAEHSLDSGELVRSVPTASHTGPVSTWEGDLLVLAWEGVERFSPDLLQRERLELDGHDLVGPWVVGDKASRHVDGGRLPTSVVVLGEDGQPSSRKELAELEQVRARLLDGARPGVGTLLWLPDGHVMTGHVDGSLRTWTRSGELLRVSYALGGDAWAVWTPDGLSERHDQGALP